MRLHLAAVVALFVTTEAMAQNPGRVAAPREDGNRANGRDYQPTPSEVVPREKAAGIGPSGAQKDANGQLLERMDKDLLREQGLSTKSVPNLTKGQ